jgi:hypothetical protein
LLPQPRRSRAYCTRASECRRCLAQDRGQLARSSRGRVPGALPSTQGACRERPEIVELMLREQPARRFRSKPRSGRGFRYGFRDVCRFAWVKSRFCGNVVIPAIFRLFAKKIRGFASISGRIAE